MQAIVGDRIYKIHFQHQHFSIPVTHQRLNGKPALIKATTECRVVSTVVGGEEEENPQTTVGRGLSWCSVEDNFTKRTAREYALSRAVAGLPREVRGAILRAYFERRRK